MVCPPGCGGRKIDPNSLQQRARIAGLSEFTVYQRINRGWSVERALTTPSPGRPSGEIARAARAIGVSPSTISKRIHNSGATLVQATNHSSRWRRSPRSTGPQGFSCPCGFHGDDFCRRIGCPRKSE